MRRSIRIRVLVPVLVVGLVGGGSAFALAKTAGHSFGTVLAMDARGRVVQTGHDVHLYGTLSSGRNRCKSARSIEIDRDGAAIATATTTSTGHFAFTDSAPESATHHYRAKFAGGTFGSAGQNTCKASASRVVTVTVN